jgi:hypothetical protein
MTSTRRTDIAAVHLQDTHWVCLVMTAPHQKSTLRLSDIYCVNTQRTSPVPGPSCLAMAPDLVSLALLSLDPFLDGRSHQPSRLFLFYLSCVSSMGHRPDRIVVFLSQPNPQAFAFLKCGCPSCPCCCSCLTMDAVGERIANGSTMNWLLLLVKSVRSWCYTGHFNFLLMLQSG